MRAIPAGKPAPGWLIQRRKHPALDVLIVAARTPRSGRIDQCTQPFRGKAPENLAHCAGAYLQPLGNRLGAVPGGRPQQDLHAQQLQLAGAIGRTRASHS